MKTHYHQISKDRGHGRNLSLSTFSWSESELALLHTQRFEQRLEWDEIAPEFPDRPKDTIRRQYYRMVGLARYDTHVQHTAAEDAIIIQRKEEGESFGKMTAALPGRTAKSVKNRYHNDLKNAQDPKREET